MNISAIPLPGMMPLSPSIGSTTGQQLGGRMASERQAEDEAARVADVEVADNPLHHDLSSPEEQQQRALLRELQQREQEVIAHENAHRAAGAGLVRGGGYDYVQGPDGRRYIAGGDVQIDASAVPGDPVATMAKAEQVIRAALAPVDPSPQDLQVAAAARAMYQQASIEAQLEQYRDNQAGTGWEPGMQLDRIA